MTDKFCSQCGECCRVYIPVGFAWSKDLEEYYKTHGFRIEYTDDGKPRYLFIPVTCPHLQLNVFTLVYECDIFETRPKLCRDNGKPGFYHPKGCTNVRISME